MKKKFRKLRFEKLDDRCLLAGGVMMGSYPDIPEGLAAKVQVTNLLIEQGEFLPGSSGVVERFLVSTVSKRHVFAQISADNTQFVFAPVFGEGFFPNIRNFTLRIDGDGNMNNGCEMVIGSASPSWESGLVIITATQNLWFCNTPRMAELTADFNTYLSGESIASDLAGVFGMRDLGGREIPADTIEYIGANPTIHTMLDSTFSIGQKEAQPFESVSDAWPVRLVEFSGWGNGAMLNYIAFDLTNPGNLSSQSFWLSEDSNWDGHADRSWMGIFSEISSDIGQVSFDLGAGTSGGNFWVDGWTADEAMKDNTFQMTLNGKVTATDSITGLPLKGVAINGGAGQIQEWVCTSTIFALVPDPVLVVYSGDLTPDAQPVLTYADAGQEITVASFDIKNISVPSLNVEQIVLSPAQGDVRNCESYKLWEVEDDGGKRLVASGFTMVMDYNKPLVVAFRVIPFNQMTIGIGTTAHYEATAVVSSTAYYPQVLQVQLDPFASDIYETDGNIDDVFYWLGQNPYFAFFELG